MPPSRGSAAPPMATRSFISVVCATPPALADRAEPVGVGDPHVGQEDLVELGLAGDLAQRPDLHPGVGHVADEVGQPLVLGHAGSVRATRMAQRASCAERRPHLLPVDHPVARRPRTARVARAARSDPAPGSLNSWHHTSSPVHSGRRKRCCCSAVPKARMVGAAMPSPMRDPARVVVRARPPRRTGVVHGGLQAPRQRPARRARPGSAPRPGRRRSGRGGTPPARWRPGRGPARNAATWSRRAAAVSWPALVRHAARRRRR